MFDTLHWSAQENTYLFAHRMDIHDHTTTLGGLNVRSVQ